jgi:hypothetical protein
MEDLCVCIRFLQISIFRSFIPVKRLLKNQALCASKISFSDSRLSLQIKMGVFVRLLITHDSVLMTEAGNAYRIAHGMAWVDGWSSSVVSLSVPVGLPVLVAIRGLMDYTNERPTTKQHLHLPWQTEVIAFAFDNLSGQGDSSPIINSRPHDKQVFRLEQNNFGRRETI